MQKGKEKYKIILQEELFKKDTLKGEDSKKRVARFFYFYTMNIYLTDDKSAIIDDEDFDKIKNIRWRLIKYARGHEYAGKVKRLSKGKIKTLFMHRIIMNVPVGLYVDHIDGNGLNNRKSNLRIVTSTQNRWNQRRKKLNATSQYKGVYWDKFNRCFKAQIRCNKQTFHLGSHLTEREAALAYNKAAQAYFGEYAYLNEIQALTT